MDCRAARERRWVVDDRTAYHNVSPFQPIHPNRSAFRDVLNEGYIPLARGA